MCTMGQINVVISKSIMLCCITSMYKYIFMLIDPFVTEYRITQKVNIYIH
jgi:hypothetical protein